MVTVYLSTEWFPRYSSVLPTSRVFSSGYIKWKSILCFFYKIILAKQVPVRVVLAAPGFFKLYIYIYIWMGAQNLARIGWLKLILCCCCKFEQRNMAEKGLKRENAMQVYNVHVHVHVALKSHMCLFCIH